MHASISAHIAANYLLNEAKGEWGPSLEQFRSRLGGPAAADRVANLYFTYLFVLRAVLKAGPTLQAVEYSTGSPVQDMQTAHLVRNLVSCACCTAALAVGKQSRLGPNASCPFCCMAELAMIMASSAACTGLQDYWLKASCMNSHRK